jgi:protein-tyrosine-phosphatase
MLRFGLKEGENNNGVNRPPYKFLVVCTGNSARSIIGEYLLRVKSKGRFESYSAGLKPTGKVNPLTLWVLKEYYAIEATDARSKSWDEFTNVNFDFVITVCDNAKESCPVFPGHPTTAHFGSPDPADCRGADEEKRRMFVQVASQISRRVDLLCSLPDHHLEPLRIQQIGQQFPIELAPGVPAVP